MIFFYIKLDARSADKRKTAEIEDGGLMKGPQIYGASLGKERSLTPRRR